MLVDELRSEPAPARPEAQRHNPLFTRVGQRALVVEDDEVLSRFLERLLRAEGFQIEVAHTGLAALDFLRPELDLVILDLNLPELDGIGVLHRLRTRLQSLPVLVLTARSRAESAVLALESGADDCLTKPFSHLEFLARVKALLRRTPEASPESRSDELRVDAKAQSAFRGGKRIDLTPREYGLLEFLMRTPGVAVSRAVLLKELWGDEVSLSSNIVDVYMKYVRDKVDVPGLPRLIRTVRGVGYAVNPNEWGNSTAPD